LNCNRLQSAWHGGGNVYDAAPFTETGYGMEIREALTFDDVLLEPAESAILPRQANTTTRVTRTIELGIPLLSSAMDTVTESRMAIVMAQAGGMGVIHKNLEVSQQANQVRAVKKFESGMVINPVTIHPEQPLADALDLMARHSISGIPVLEQDSGKLVGILTNRDMRFTENPQTPVSELMTASNLATVHEPVDLDAAKRLLHERRIEKLLVINAEGECTGLLTVKDIQKAVLNPQACKDRLGRLRVAAASTVGNAGFERSSALIDAGVDLIVIDTAHGHSASVGRAVERIKTLSNSVQVMAGNVATAEATRAVIGAGADAIKVGIGPGSSCTTRIVAGVGVPQLTAIMDCAEEAARTGQPVIADGGIKYSGDLVKALAAGASSVMIGSLFAGTDAAPGAVVLFQGRSYKVYRGMGSLPAMASGSRDRYFQADVAEASKLVPEGIEGRVPYRGSLSVNIHQLLGGLRAGMGYCGTIDLSDLRSRTRFVRITAAGLQESHVHDVIVTKEAPNYRIE